MMIITYKDDTFAGDLNNSIRLKSDKEEMAIRNINDYTIDFTRLKGKLERYKNQIEKVEYYVDYDFEENHKEQFDSSWKKIER
jgi:CRISPR-associated protein Csh2